jgi:t-SNARE complex subunit (syntaxin)
LLLEYSHSIDELTAHVNEQANNARRTLMGASDENKFLLANPKIVSTSDMRMRRTQQTRHAKKFMEVMKKYQEMQTNYKGRYKGQLERQYLIVKPNATREELDKLTESDGAAVLTQQMFSMANRSLAKKQLDEMKERHHDILAIEKSIQELHQMFLDMALLVDQQGELIDRVGEHVEASADYTAKAAVQMEAAVSSKRRSQRCKWIMFGILLFIIIGVGIYLAILFGTGKSSGGSSPPSSAPPPPSPAPPAPGPAPAPPGPARTPAPAPGAPPPAGGQPQQQSTGPVKKRNRPNVVLNFDDQNKANEPNPINSILEDESAANEPDASISKKTTRNIYHKNRRHRHHS